MSPTAPGDTTPTPAVSNSKDNLPQGQLELATLGLASSKAWDASPMGDLRFKTKANYGIQVTAYKASLGTADEAGDTSSPNAAEFRKMDKLIDANLRYVKGYLAEDHTEDKGKAFYDEFGIERVGANWKLPVAQGARATALGKLLKALLAHGYGARKFGTAFWTAIETKYAPLVGTSGEERGEASEAVGMKNAQEAPLREMLRALVHLVRANYPDEKECKGVLRAFGFQKEVY